MLLLNTLRSALTFWRLPLPFRVLVPLLLVLACALQIRVLGKRRRIWTGAACLLALELLLALAAWILALALGRAAVGLALVLSMLLTLLHPLLLGALAGLLVTALRRR